MLTVLEHESITVGDGGITEEQSHRLVGLSRQYRTDVFKRTGKTTLKALQFVGVAQAGDVLVEVLPKISGMEKNRDGIRKNLITMLAKTRKLDIRDAEIASLATQHNLLEIIIRLFCDRLFTEVRRGLLKRYERQEENLFVLRGKLDTSRQAKFNAAHPERLFCQYDEFHADNPINQVLKAAVVCLRKVSVNSENQRRLSELYFILDEITEVHPSRLEWHRIHMDRTSKRFHTLLTLAKLFLHKEHQDVHGGAVDGFSLMFDMNRLFEEYIGEMVREVFGDTIRTQGPQLAMLQDESGSKAFWAKPDITCSYNEDGTLWIMDTKWKELDPTQTYHGVDQADIYQMMVYGHRYNCARIVLLYPHVDRLGIEAGIIKTYSILRKLENKERLIQIVTVSLSGDGLNKSVCEQMKKLFNEINWQK